MEVWGVGCGVWGVRGCGAWHVRGCGYQLRSLNPTGHYLVTYRALRAVVRLRRREAIVRRFEEGEHAIAHRIVFGLRACVRKRVGRWAGLGFGMPVGIEVEVGMKVEVEIGVALALALALRKGTVKL